MHSACVLALLSDLVPFAYTLAEVPTLHARTNRSKRRRASGEGSPITLTPYTVS